MAIITVAAGQTYLANHFRFPGGTDGISTVADSGHTFVVSPTGQIEADYVDYQSYLNNMETVVGVVRSTTTITLPYSTYADPGFGSFTYRASGAYTVSTTGDFELTYGAGPVIATISGAAFTYSLIEVYSNYYGDPTPYQEWVWGVNFSLSDILSGDDTVTLASGNDYFVDSAGRLVLFAGDGNDTIIALDDLSGSSQEDDVIYGDTGNDYLLSSGVGSLIYGGAGQDRLVGNFGQTLDGGAGNDNVTTAGDDTILERAGSGNDLYSGAGLTGALDTLSYAAGSAAIVIDESLFGAAVDYGIYGVDTIINIQSIIGSKFSDVIVGNDFQLVDNMFLGGAGNDTLAGGAGNDTVAGGIGADLISGGDGDDLLTGVSGKDTLVGGTGDDHFIYLGVAASPVGAGRDIISDFEDGIDHIDLSSLDAISGGANDAFNFIGSAAFTALGQIRAVQVGTSTLVSVNLAGGLAADMQIELSGAHALTAFDFIL